ncbi:hypothetical protein LTR37_018368 [Vermiconidia calcicola]|uniref:Uncharacterized protein n=1 Tax=Vermiconidia calcicola TaxID=1690605 RepID=A0ACC3MH93_9PEZI|nr:hypothetical protein LTR37_018368 [Vermiconidia calcicola]
MTVTLEQINSKYAKDLPRSTQLFPARMFSMPLNGACEYNLTDYTLPPYYKLENYLRYIMASSDCYDSEKWRQAAKGLY